MRAFLIFVCMIFLLSLGLDLNDALVQKRLLEVKNKMLVEECAKARVDAYRARKEKNEYIFDFLKIKRVLEGYKNKKEVKE